METFTSNDRRRYSLRIFLFWFLPDLFCEMLVKKTYFEMTWILCLQNWQIYQNLLWEQTVVDCGWRVILLFQSSKCCIKTITLGCKISCFSRIRSTLNEIESDVFSKSVERRLRAHEAWFGITLNPRSERRRRYDAPAPPPREANWRALWISSTS